MVRPKEGIWVFTATGRAGGIFRSPALAGEWIRKHHLSGILTEYPLDEGCFDWAVRNQVHSMSPTTFERRRHDPEFIGNFTTASQMHFHFDYGQCREFDEFLAAMPEAKR